MNKHLIPSENCQNTPKMSYRHFGVMAKTVVNTHFHFWSETCHGTFQEKKRAWAMSHTPFNVATEHLAQQPWIQLASNSFLASIS
jgi:hypothetical protein